MSNTAANILNYIPQRPPFVMIDDIGTIDGPLTQTYFTAKEDHLFVQNGVFTGPGLVENMAQTAAAGTGYKAWQEGKPAPVGFIGAVKNLEIKELPKVGQKIRTEIIFQQQIMNAQLLHGKVFIAEREIASCDLRIYIRPAS